MKNCEGKRKSSVLIEVESIAAPCSAGIQVGDKFRISNCDGSVVMEDFDGCCPELFNAVFPIAMTLIHEGEIPWEDAEGKARSVCPDGHCRVQVALSRTEMKSADDLEKIRSTRSE